MIESRKIDIDWAATILARSRLCAACARRPGQNWLILYSPLLCWIRNSTTNGALSHAATKMTSRAVLHQFTFVCTDTTKRMRKRDEQLIQYKQTSKLPTTILLIP